MKKRVVSLLLAAMLLLAAYVPAAAAPQPYESPIDFEVLQSVNPDVYGWLRISDTVIDYPVVQHPTLNDYYLHHDGNGNIDLDGAIFSLHEYNGTDFEDPVTVLYGHNMKSGSMFGTLRSSYSDQQFFDEHKDVIIYTPEEALIYKVFAAVPYSDELIPYKHDFTDEREYNAFFDGVLNIRDLSARFDETNKPEFGDRVLILSTCISGTDMRFLVMATLSSDLENRSES